jgi:hypothetical protein
MVGLRLMSAAAIFLSLACVQASAEGGCGFGFHRGPNGSCRMNPGVTVAPVEIYHPPVARPPVVGTGTSRTAASGLWRWFPLEFVIQALRGPLTGRPG